MGPSRVHLVSVVSDSSGLSLTLQLLLVLLLSLLLDGAEEPV